MATRFNERKEFRLYVKIRFSENGNQSFAEVAYFRNDMTLHFYERWKWYFQYRAALLKVNYPRSFVELSHGSYQYELPTDLYEKKVKSLLIGAKRELTKFTCKLENIRQNWTQIFPMEEDSSWGEVQEKMNYYKKRVEELQAEHDAIQDGSSKFDNIEVIERNPYYEAMMKSKLWKTKIELNNKSK